MIEVEIRGPLNKSQYETFRSFLAKEGKFIKHIDREAFFLYGHPGYAHDPLERTVDIRLRNTNGECEIMVKQKISENNEARKEISLKLKDNNLETAKEVVKALGISKALRIERSSDIYEYRGIEWSIVRAPKDHFFYEAERSAKDKEESKQVQKDLALEAARVKLNVFTPKEDQEFIYLLFKEVDEEVLL
jgi:predicted adenylyl cyclase CyaB